MKKVFAILLIFVVSSYAGRTVTIKVRDHVAIQKSIEDSAAMFIKEIKPFLETPMSWCTVEPTGEASVYPTDKKNVYLVRVTAEMSCSEKMAYSNFKSIANRYKTFILNNARIIDNMIGKQYPNLEFKALMMNHTFAVAIRYKKKHGGDTRNHYRNKIKFFKMVLNDKFISPDLKVFRERGELISTTLTNPPPPYKVSEEFTFEVYQKTPINDNLKIRFETVYHPTPEDIKTLQ